MRNAAMDFYRFIFAVVICILHIKEYAGVKPYPMSGGYLAVEFYLVLSGYLLMQHASKMSKNVNKKNN